MESISESSLNHILDQRKSVEFIFISTPLCGTCKLAAKMLTILEQTTPHLKIYEINVNEATRFVQRWKVHSVPALFIFQKGLGIERIYAFHSIAHLYEKLSPYISFIELHNENKNKGGC
ncbi:thioredoxin family protein [Alkalihalophilus lindianensis]|uniref:Thioredoxin family protein n=1 Tax=Alkalihalophilus lindianensis TaxID=1630542 RepID=A0ABU3X6J0_9BACI|nr:thioredoxin family protein [Alkalihalophilus lindianensis]MDV2683526.1 thioredoxin family protein [Alkalihalophilus lindianensis]